MEDSSDISTKYQKLALEYSKLKAQIAVLKSAITDEKANSAEYQEAVKKKDQLVRKLEQEVECLNFRNLQLTKRVSVLQSELESVNSNSKNSRGKHVPNSAAPDSYGVLNSELQNRIEENEKLHKQIFTEDLEHKRELSELTSTVEKLQNDLAHQERMLNEKITEQDALINSLQKEKDKMQMSLQKFEREIKEQKKKEKKKAKDITPTQQDSRLEHENTQSAISNKDYFNDSYNAALNSLNVPDVLKHKQLCKSVEEIHSFVSDFCRHLSDLYALMIQRLCSTSPISDAQGISVKLESNFKDSISQIKAIPPSFEKVATTIKDESLSWDKSAILEFSEAFQKYVILLDELMPYLILRVQNKESWNSSSPRSSALVPKLTSLCKRLVNCFKNVQRYLDLLGAVDGQSTYLVKQSVIIHKVFSNLETLQLLFEEARKLFGSKIIMDQKIPNLTQGEKSTDERILSTLVSISTTLEKLSGLMLKDMETLSSDEWYRPRYCASCRNCQIQPDVLQSESSGSQYSLKTSQSDTPSIPDETILESQKKLQEQADCIENLNQELAHYQKKLMQLELDKEKWMLECTLMKAREKQNVGLASDGDNVFTPPGSEDIHKYVQSTINQMIQQVQFADSKFIAYRNECGTIYQKLKMCYQKKEDLENDIRNAKLTIEQMKDEHKNISHSYEEQLSSMNEHVANLNEKLTSQRDEIDALKLSGGKGLKKGKSR